MGYYTRAFGTVTVKPENLDRLRKLVEDLYRDEDGTSAELEALSDNDLDTLIFHCPCVPWGNDGPILVLTPHQQSQHGPGLHFTWIEDAFRAATHDIRYFFEQIEEVIEDGEFHFFGEDDYKYKWIFKGGVLHDLEGQTVYVDGRFDAAEATEALKAIIGLLYPRDEVRNNWDQATLWQVADILRERGFGPLAGKPFLDVLAAESGAAK